MTKTVLMGVLYHETHTFLHQKTGMAQFEQSGIFTGNEIIAANLGNGSPTDGFLEFASACGWNVFPTIQMMATPSGKVEDRALAYFKKTFFKYLDNMCGDIDGIYLVLHGAMVSESCDDVEGELLYEIHDFLSKRSIDIPVVALLDLHANVSKKMTEYSSCLYSYQKNPHSDARDAAIMAAKLLERLMYDPGVNQMFLSSKYIIPPTGQGTANEPLKSTLAKAREIEAKDSDILCINVMGGYAYADAEDCGFSLNCCTRGDERIAQKYLEEIKAVFESKVNHAYPLEASLEDVLDEVSKTTRDPGPVLLIEPSDNIGGGTPGDGTGVLKPLLEMGYENIIAIINDPEAAANCHELAVNDVVDLTIGAKIDEYHGEPVHFTGVIEKLSDGKFELENKQSHLASMGGINIDMGLCAVIKNDQAQILLTSNKTPPMDLGQLHSQNIRPESAEFIIVKAAVSHKDAYDPIASLSFYVDSPGLCTSTLERLPYQKISGKKISN